MQKNVGLSTPLNQKKHHTHPQSSPKPIFFFSIGCFDPPCVRSPLDTLESGVLFHIWWLSKQLLVLHDCLPWIAEAFSPRLSSLFCLFVRIRDYDVTVEKIPYLHAYLHEFSALSSFSSCFVTQQDIPDFLVLHHPAGPLLFSCLHFAC